MNNKEDLLQPSLGEQDSASAAPYSAQTGFLTAFLGGPFAVLTLHAVNSRRLGRLRRDLPLYVLAAAAVVASLWWVYHSDVQARLREALGSRSLSIAFRAAGLALFGLGYAIHRRQYRLMDIAGITAPNGLKIGIACCVGGNAVFAALSLLFAPAESP